MSEAIVLNDAYKKFSNPTGLLWKRMPRLSGKATGTVNAAAAANGCQSHVVAVNRVSFTVTPGEIFGVVGPNGAGKSTLIRLIATLLLPDGGDIQVFGYDVVNQPMQVQGLINRVSVDGSFFRQLSPVENLVYGARLYGLRGRETRRQAVDILTRLGLDEHAIYQPMEEISRGMQQKVVIARALLSRPRLLLLDEPAAGLDPSSRREVQAVIRELRDDHGLTILLATQDIAEAENLCDRVAMINRGKIVALDTPAGLAHNTPGNGCTPAQEAVCVALTGKRPVREGSI